MLVRSLRRQNLAPLIASLTSVQESASAPSCSGRDTTTLVSELRLGTAVHNAHSCPWRVHSRVCSTESQQPQQSASDPNFAGLFSQNPHEAAHVLAAKLTPAQRAVLASALAQHTEIQQIDEKYWEELFRAHDSQGNTPGALTRSEFQAAMIAHNSLLENRNRTPPTSSALKMVFLASGIPFIAFGFLDNAIMLVAGEEIDQLFGIRLGLSTLASAGLGNALADVIGVGAAKYIEQVVRWLPFVKEPKLSKFQQAMPSTQRAKLAGAMLGVFSGCLLGLTPLFLSGSFFRL